MFVYNILIMEKSNTSYNGRIFFIPNPDIDDNWIRRFTDGWKELEHTTLVREKDDSCNGKDYDLFLDINTYLTDRDIALSMSFIALNKKVNKSYSSNIDQSNHFNNKKHILVITLPSNFLSILKILKTNKEQYFTLYQDKWSLKGRIFDAIIVDSSMPYHLEFYNSVKKYIRYDVPIYLLEKETLKTLKQWEQIK